MLIDLHYLVKKYNIEFKGILHVGAHECEELNDYLKYVSMDKILWIEALSDKVDLNKCRHPGIQIENAVVSDVDNQIVKFNRTNNGQSSSMLEFGLHSVNHPHVWNIESELRSTKTLNSILQKYPDMNVNFINLDIQGCELRALKGMSSYLDKAEYIYTEVNDDEVYIGCDKIDELDKFLADYNFVRVETNFCENYHWGDALYVRFK